MKMCGAILVSAALAMVAASGCSRTAQPAVETKVAPKVVQTIAARQMSVEQTVYGTGPLAAQDRAVLSAKVPGRVESVLVDLGAKVQKGDLLAQIQKREFELKRQQAEAAVAQ